VRGRIERGSIPAVREGGKVRVRLAGRCRSTAETYLALSGANPDDLEQHRNVVIVWDRSPRADDADAVRGCLGASFVR
jgi:hypothetical protein